MIKKTLKKQAGLMEKSPLTLQQLRHYSAQHGKRTALQQQLGCIYNDGKHAQLYSLLYRQAGATGDGGEDLGVGGGWEGRAAGASVLERAQHTTPSYAGQPMPPHPLPAHAPGLCAGLAP